MATERTRLNLVLPKDLVRALREEIPPRRRGAFVAEAVQAALQRRRLLRAIRESAGAWKAADHPELSSPAAVEKWLRQQRRAMRWVR